MAKRTRQRSFDIFDMRQGMGPPNADEQRRRANWSQLVPEIVFVLYLCGGNRDFVRIEVIALKATTTYPRSFQTHMEGKKVPDLSLIYLALNEAKKSKRGHVSGDWYHGWKLTRRGLLFARDIERRAHEMD